MQALRHITRGNVANSFHSVKVIRFALIPTLGLSETKIYPKG
jgi:hypothetical protein